MTQAEHDDLNEALASREQVVLVKDDQFYLCNIVPVQKIENIITFGAIYGVTIAP